MYNQMLNEYREKSKNGPLNDENNPFGMNQYPVESSKDYLQVKEYGRTQQYPNFVKYESSVKEEEVGINMDVLAEINAPNFNYNAPNQLRHQCPWQNRMPELQFEQHRAYIGGVNRLYLPESHSRLNMDDQMLIKEEDTPQDLLSRLSVSTNLVLKENQGLVAIKYEDHNLDYQRKNYTPY